MKIKIEFDCDNAAFESGPYTRQLAMEEVYAVLKQAMEKIVVQLGRPHSVCDAPEAADKLLDSNGNTVGSVIVEGV